MHNKKFSVRIFYILSIFINFAHQNEKNKDCIRMY